MPDPDPKYVRVYYSIRSDERFETIYGDDAALACWIRLLLDADAVWPAPASVPKSAKAGPFRKLLAAGIVEVVPGGFFRIHGLDPERAKRSHAARIANAVRWDSERSPNGVRTDPQARVRFDPSKAETSKDETSRADGDRPDIDAFLGVRFRLPTPAQRTFMDAYCQVFDVTGPERAAKLIWEHSDDPIGALKEDLHAFREGRKAEAIAAEAPKPRRTSGSGLTGVNADLAKLFWSQNTAEVKVPEP